MGTVTLTIEGDLSEFRICCSPWIITVVKVLEWGDYEIGELNSAFARMDTVIFEATDAPNLSSTISISSMFYKRDSENLHVTYWDVDFSSWDTSNIKYMNSVFKNSKIDNCSMGEWNVANVKDMSSMFRGATSFNGDLSSWNVANVGDMSGLFADAPSFNGDLSSWNVASVKDMSSMFRGATSFNGDLSSWNVANVGDMSGLFADAPSFNGDLSSWNVANVKDMSSMFAGASSFNGDLSSWNVANVKDMSSMFAGASSFNADISSWSFRVGSLSNVFNGASSFNQNLGGWNMSNVSNLSGFLDGVTLSKENYDSLLIGWSKQNLHYGLTFDAGKNIPSEKGRETRSKISREYGWEIVDGDGLTVKNEEQKETMPNSYSLSQNYPNPFNPATIIQFRLPKSSEVKIDIFSLTGSYIETIIDKRLKAGVYSINFNATNYSSGTYFYRLTANGYSKTKKMVFIK